MYFFLFVFLHECTFLIYNSWDFFLFSSLFLLTALTAALEESKINRYIKIPPKFFKELLTTLAGFLFKSLLAFD